MADLWNHIDENVDDLVREKRIMVESNTKHIEDIKLVCANYFQKYDEKLEGVLGES